MEKVSKAVEFTQLLNKHGVESREVEDYLLKNMADPRFRRQARTLLLLSLLKDNNDGLAGVGARLIPKSPTGKPGPKFKITRVR